MSSINKLSDQEVIKLYKERLRLIKAGEIAPTLLYDDHTYESLKSNFQKDKTVAEMLRYVYGEEYEKQLKKGKKKENVPKENYKSLAKLDDSEVVDLFKKRAKLLKEGKIDPWATKTSGGTYDPFTFDEMKEMFGGMKGAVVAIREGYPRGISLTETKKSSPSPKKDTKEGTKEERRRAYEKQLKNIANEAVRTTNLKNLIGMTNNNVIAKYGKTRGEALVAKRKKAGPGESMTKTVVVDGSLPKGKHIEVFLEYDNVSLKKMSDKSVRVKGTVIDSKGGRSTISYTDPRKESEKTKKKTENYNHLTKLDDSEVVDLFKKRVKLVKEGRINQSGIYDSFTFDDLKKTFGGMKGAVGAIRTGYPRGISVAENKKNSPSSSGSLSPFSKAMLSNDEDNIDFENIEKFMKEDEEREKEQARLAAEDERRKKDREALKESQEKQRKELEKQQRIQDEFWARQEQKEQQKKKLERTMTPTTKLNIAGGKEKFTFANRITKCSRVLTLDQVDAPTCWFNALMMALFFSQNTRIAIASSLKYIKETWKFPIVVKISKLLEGYNKERASKYLYERLQPKEFLTTLRQHYPQQFPMLKRKAQFKEGDYSSYQGDSLEYMHRMLQFLEIQHLFLSRPSMKSGRTEWSHYNYDLMGNKIWGDDDSLEFNPRTDTSTLRTVDTRHPIILTMLVENHYDKKMTEGAKGKWKTYQTYPVEGLYSDSHARTIKYNGMKYYLDSMILGSYNNKACDKGHAIAGVTCNGDRFLYNGWTSRTVDKGFERPNKVRREACPLNQTDWARTTNFCINTENCTFDTFVSKMETKTLCFSTLRNVALTYVREDYVGNRIPSIPAALDRMKQKQTEEGIFNNKRLENMGVLKYDPRTRKYVVKR